MRTDRCSRSVTVSYILCGAVAAAALLCAAVYAQMLAHTREVLGFEVRQDANRVIAEAVNRAVGDDAGECIVISRDSGGNVTSAETDSAAVNILENRLKSEINAALSELYNSEVGVPVGTLTGFAPLVGKGHRLRIGLEQHGTADVKLESEFSTAGVNQTRCRLTLAINVEILAVLGGRPQTVTVTDEYIVSDTVIVGRPLFGEGS